ncbi:MAG: TPD domain-containing protein [Euryarchaeota archaeon]|nr:TPD domain-containing protein [Euryarchaeota archaeon]
MKYEEFKAIYNELNEYSDVKRLAKETGLDEEFLNVIYTQRTVRDATKRHHIVKRNARRLLRDWKRGSSLMTISKQWRFPPILTGLLIFQENGYSKKQFWNHVRNPEEISNKRLRKEIIEITKADTIYSPWGNKIQQERGEWGEAKLQEWLESHDLSFRTEDDLRGKYPKTPDCLLDEPIRVNGWTINWIESKASFGDRVEFRRNVRRQLSHYVDLFGHGLVVYWFGHVQEVDCPPGIEIIDASLCDLDCYKASEEEFCPEEIPRDSSRA